MRLVALALLLANVLLLAWARYAPDPGATESQLLGQQIRPEAIHVLSPAEVAALQRTSDAAQDGEKTAACVEWGAFNSADVTRARGLLEGVVAADRVAERQVEDAAGWWVFLPPQPSRPAANQKVAELKRLGVDDYFIVQEDPKFRFAISLGVYRSEEAARARLEQLRGRGVRTAQVATRQTPVRKVFLQLRQVPEALQPRLAELRDSFPGTGLGACGS